jgi:hypothetical protein
VPHSTVVEAFRSAKHSLTVAIACSQNLSALPEKKYIAPNQKMWKETADHMGVRWPPKKKRLPDEHRITDRSIGVVKGKCRHKYNDPYAGGK